MRNKILIILTIVMLLGLVSSECQENNEFLVGENINICLGSCIYQNANNLAEYIECDNNIKCYVSAFYDNNTNIVLKQEMQRTGNIFNFSLGNINKTGVHFAFVNCLNVNSMGWFDTSFNFVVGVSPSSSTSTHSATTIVRSSKLNLISLKYNNFLFDFDNILNIAVLDRNNENLNIDNLTVDVISSIKHNFSIEKISTGEYNAKINIPTQNIDGIYVKITALDEGRIVEKLEYIEISDSTAIERLKLSSFAIISDVKRNIKQNVFTTIVVCFIIIVLLLIFIFARRK